MMEGLKAYGAGMAGGRFDPIGYIRKPQVILRLVSWVFSIIVFGCISSSGYSPIDDTCLYSAVLGEGSGACGFGVGIGVFAFILLTVFLIIDALFDNLSSIQHRKYVVMADLGISGLWTFLWFVCFCYLCDAWRKTPEFPPELDEIVNANDLRAAIAFSFFSIASWAGLIYFAFLKYREGAAKAFSPDYTDHEGGVPGAGGPGGVPYSAYPGGPESAEPYREPPFSQSGATMGQPPMQDYQAPAY